MLDEALQAMDTASAAQPRNHLVFYYYCQCALQSWEGSLIKSDRRGGGDAITPQPPSVTRIIDD